MDCGKGCDENTKMSFGYDYDSLIHIADSDAGPEQHMRCLQPYINKYTACS